jgi:tetratricopeptide (TPR) repeat protein
MKFKLSAFLILLLVLCLTVYAQAQSNTPQQTLQQYVADLQSHTNDDALRQKIIALAQTMRTPPAVPADAYELVGRAAYAIKNANTDADFVAAADAYGKALQLAPWVADYYFNQGVAYEKAKHFDEAIADFNWYLTAAPNAKDANEVRERIGGLKYAKEKAEQERRAAEEKRVQESSPEAIAARKQAEDEEWLKRLDGARYISHDREDLGLTDTIDIHGDHIQYGTINNSCSGCKSIPIGAWGVRDFFPPPLIQGRQYSEVDRYQGHQTTCAGTITDEVITTHCSNGTYSTTTTYYRQR